MVASGPTGSIDYTGTFEDSCGRVIRIRLATEPDEFPFRVQVTLPASIDLRLREHVDYPFEIVGELMGSICRDHTVGEHLKVEGGIFSLVMPGGGPTLDLFPLSQDELKPKVSIGLYDDWEKDCGLPWAFPLSVYRRRVD